MFGRFTKRSRYEAVLPPLTLMIWPVMNDALLEATNTIVSAISSGRPARFSGTPATRPAFRSALPVKRSSIAVSIGPGATALTRTPNAAASSAALAHGRRQIDDAASSLRLHHPQLVLHAEQHAEHVGVEGGGVAVGGLLGHRAGLALGAGVVDGDVEAAEPGDRLVDQVLHVAFVADIGADEFRFRAKRAQFGDQRFANIIAAAGNHDTGAFLCESERGGAADAG